jgi:hypothetical protein
VLAETTEVDAVASDAAFNLIPILNKELVALAMASKWPMSVIRNLSVTFDGSSLYVDFGNSAAEVQALEYGSKSALPNSVIRSFGYKAGPIIKQFYQNNVASNLFDLEDIYV